jgi:hypothetical protein
VSSKKEANSLVPLILGSIDAMRLETGLVTPAEKRGFCRRIALRSVDPDRGSPEIRWSAGKIAVQIVGPSSADRE